MLKIVQKSKEKAYSDKNLGKNTQEKSKNLVVRLGLNILKRIKSLLFIIIFIDQCKMKRDFGDIIVKYITI